VDLARGAKSGACAVAAIAALALATGCGGGSDKSSSNTTSQPASTGPSAIQGRVNSITSCLKKAGLPPKSTTAGQGGKSTVLTVSLHGQGSAILYVYDSSTAAAVAAKAIAGFLKIRGGTASAKGDVVVGFSKGVTSSQKKPVEACV
jgi:hypothetical protein